MISGELSRVRALENLFLFLQTYLKYNDLE